MPLLVYRPTLFRQTAENLQFRVLCEELQRRVRYADSRNKSEVCLFVGNFNFSQKEFDAFLIKKNGILLIEFKNYGGKIKVTNNEWTGVYEDQPFIVKGGSDGKTPLEQAKLNRNAFVRDMVASGALSQDQANKISSVVVFNHDSEIENKLRLNIQTWLHVCDNTSFFGIAESIINNNMDLSAVDLKRLADRIVLDDDYIVDEFSDTDFLDTWNDPDALKEYSDKLDRIVQFPDEPDPIKADQEGTLELNPEQDPSQTVNPVSAPVLDAPEEAPSPTVQEAIPCDNVPRMVANFISLVQTATTGNIPFSVFDCKVSAPEVNFDIDKQYLVKVMAEPTDANALNLKKFVRDSVFQGCDCLYWTIGEHISPIKGKVVDYQENSECLEFRTSSAILAPWLDSFIFNQLGASYDPRYKRFEYNDDLGEDEAKIYLGTYFPRSYAEHFLIFENLFLNSRYKARIEAKNSLVIFSIGSGTGGDIIGLLTAIDKYIHSGIPATVIALDVNEHSLELQKQVIERYKSISSRTISLQQFPDRITGEETFTKYAEVAFPDKSIDYLLFSKVGCELHGKNVFGNKNVYGVLLDTFMPKVSESGLVSILDVTTKVDGTEFMPTVMNRGINAFVLSNPEYSSLVPQSCCAYERVCASPCFFQQDFFVSHCKKTNDLSKVCYRLVARKEMCDAVIKGCGKKLVINPAKLESGSAEAYCRMSVGLSEERDAFNVNN